jgi:hypothetical protein
LAKKQPNDLKIGHMMCLYGFYRFQNFWKISPFFGRFLAKKRRFFTVLAKKNENNFSAEN